MSSRSTPSTSGSPESQDLRRLLDILDIQGLKAKYCRYIDTKQWDRLQTLFSPEARFEGFGSAPDGATLEVFIRGVSSRLEACVSVHRCTMPEIAFLGTQRARVVWAMHDLVQWPPGFAPAEAPRGLGFEGYGHYEDLCERVGGAWRIVSTRLTRLRIDPIDPATPAPGRGRLSASNDWLDGISTTP